MSTFQVFRVKILKVKTNLNIYIEKFQNSSGNGENSVYPKQLERLYQF